MVEEAEIFRGHDEIVKDIKTVLEEKVAPSVAAHNGSIGFISFADDTGVATLKLSGSCSGCAMSKITMWNFNLNSCLFTDRRFNKFIYLLYKFFPTNHTLTCT